MIRSSFLLVGISVCALSGCSLQPEKESASIASKKREELTIMQKNAISAYFECTEKGALSYIESNSSASYIVEASTSVCDSIFENDLKFFVYEGFRLIPESIGYYPDAASDRSAMVESERLLEDIKSSARSKAIRAVVQARMPIKNQINLETPY